METADYFSLVINIISVVGFLLLFCGDASHISFRTLELMFVRFALNFPLFGSGNGVPIDEIIRYSIFGLIYLYILGPVRRTTRIQQTYQPLLDSFRFHRLLVLLAALATLLMFLFLTNGVGGCTPSLYMSAEVTCTYSLLYTVAYCLGPLVFLPQIYLWWKVSLEGTPLNFNVRAFLFCMGVIAVINIVFDLLFLRGYWWKLCISSDGLTLLVLLAPSMKNAVCPRVCRNHSEAYEAGIALDTTNTEAGEPRDLEAPSITVNGNTRGGQPWASASFT